MSVLYGSNVLDSTLTTACVLATTSGGTEVSAATTIPATSNAYAEILPRGGSSTAVASIPSPSGKGWIYWPGAGTFAAGNWSASITHSAVTKGVNTVVRFYKYSGGTYTAIGTITATSTATAKTTYSYSATSMSSVTLASGDGIYADLIWFDNNSNSGGDNPTIYTSNSSTAGVVNDVQITTSTFTPSATTSSRTVPATVALQSTNARTIPASTALQSTNPRTVPSTAALQSLGNARTVPATAAIANTFSRTVPATAALSQPVSRTVPASAALQSTNPRTIPATAALQSLNNTRTVPASAALLKTTTRTVPASVSLANTVSRTVPATAALTSLGLSRTIPATASLIHTISRIIPASTSLYQPAVFYASNVTQTLGGLNLSDQMSMTPGGTETSVSVTMPSSGTNSYVELLAQGGTASGTPVIPSPSGKGWSISLTGNTILAGNWSSVFTLAKSGTSKSGASLYVRWYRRTMDGTYYPIQSAVLSSQTFSTSKTVYTTPSAFATLWQFIAGDTLYMDVFVFNGSTAWASDVFTVYVSNSATQGVYNDAIIIAPEVVSTPTEIACYIGATNLQTGSTLPVLNQSFTLADAIDQRSILTLTGEDVVGTLSYQRGMPTYLGDHDQGKLYDGYVNSDKVSKPAAGNSNAQLEHTLTMMDHHYDADKRANTTNYLNWSAGDMTCDFIQQTLSQEGVTGAFALESDYTPTTFGQGTLSGTVATTTTSPFTYAPNTATPPITSNTGDLELTRAGTQLTLTESTTSDFSSGTLNNMVASNNQIAPSTQSAIKVTAIATQSASSPNFLAIGTYTGGVLNTETETAISEADIQIWGGSMTVGSNDTLNYDIWVSSTSPAFIACVQTFFSDGSSLTSYTGGTPDTGGSAGIYDQNNVSADLLTDLSDYAKDAWYTRSIPMTGLSGKTITNVTISIDGSVSGTYTIFIKNCYLGSHSGSPFFGTTWTSPNMISISCQGIYATSLTTASVVQVYNPLTSYRVSPAHSISGVGLVQNSSIAWTASLPGSVSSTTYPPGTQTSSSSTSGASSMLMLISYDGNTWLECQNSQALPGLPPGANVSGLSLYLREQFAPGSDPSALPALLDVSITINSAAAQTVSDVVAAYGTTANWNGGTKVGVTPDANGDLSLVGGQISPAWTSLTSDNIYFFYDARGYTSQSASSGTYTLSSTSPSSATSYAAETLFSFAGSAKDFTLTCKLSVQSTNSAFASSCILYRTTGWTATDNNFGYGVGINTDGNFFLVYGSNANGTNVGTLTDIMVVSKTMSQGTLYPIKIVVKGDHHQAYFNNETNPSIDVIDRTYQNAGGIGVYQHSGGSVSTTATTKISNFVLTAANIGTWTSPSISLSALGTCGYNQIAWTEISATGQPQSTAVVESSLDGGTTWQTCANGAEIPQLPRGTSVTGKSLLLQISLSAANHITAPIIEGLYLRVCGSYGTVTGTRISPAINLSPVGYVDSSNVMWNANIPTSTSLTVQTTQDLSAFHTVGSNGAGEALTYWTNQPSATQDLFSSNTSANYTSTSKSGGSAASVTYTTTNSSVTLVGGSGALYLNNAITTSDVDLLVDTDWSDAGGIAWREVSNTNYYELGVYDASSSGGFANQLRLYKVASGVRSLLGSASSVTFTRGTVHRIRVKMKGGLINVYWDGTCMQSYLDTSPLGSGACGLRNDGGTSRYYQLWIQPLGTNLTGQALYTKVTMTTSDPSVMPQLFTLVACIRGPSIATGATISQLHPVTTPFAAYYASEMDTLVQASGDYFWYIDKWKQLHFGPRLARPGAFPVQSATDQDPANPANVYSGYLLYQPMVSVLSSADLFRSQQIVTNVSGLVTPPPEIKVADGSTTSWTMGYPLYSAPTILINGQGATVGVQGIDNNRQFYWQPGSASISYDSSLPKLPSGTVLNFNYVGESTRNVILDNSAAQAAQAALELNSGIVAEIESALNTTSNGMTTDQATTFGNGLLSRYGNNGAIELVGTTRYPGIVPGTTIPLFLSEIMSTWNVQLPVSKVTTTVYQGQNGLIWLYSIDATNGANVSNWQRMFFAK